jgi:hypothetical protein
MNKFLTQFTDKSLSGPIQITAFGATEFKNLFSPHLPKILDQKFAQKHGY